MIKTPKHTNVGSGQKKKNVCKKKNKSVNGMMNMNKMTNTNWRERYREDFVERGYSPTADGHDMTPDKWNDRYESDEDRITALESFISTELTSLSKEILEASEGMKKELPSKWDIGHPLRKDPQVMQHLGGYNLALSDTQEKIKAIFKKWGVDIN